MRNLYLGLFLLIFLGSVITQTNADDKQSDPEAANIMARVTDISHEIEYVSFVSSGNHTIINLSVSLEYWNPYIYSVISYGSSSCRWVTTTESFFEQDHYIGNQPNICLADWTPRNTPSGVSNGGSFNQVWFYNVTLQSIPNGFILVNGRGGIFSNTTDIFYGANISIYDGAFSIEFEPLPDNWGNILYYGPIGYYLLPALVILILIVLRRKKLF